jgi:hypothetical protein
MMEDTIRLAREAQLSKDGFGAWLAMDEDLDRLIKLAISEAKDAWAEQEMDNIFQAIKIEREECAKLCDEVDKESQSQWPRRFATMIRARGKA